MSLEMIYDSHELRDKKERLEALLDVSQIGNMGVRVLVELPTGSSLLLTDGSHLTEVLFKVVQEFIADYPYELAESCRIIQTSKSKANEDCE